MLAVFDCLSTVGTSRRDLLRAMSFLMLPVAATFAQEAGLATQPNMFDTQQSVTPNLVGVPASLEGKAKKAVEQALRKSVEKNKVH